MMSKTPVVLCFDGSDDAAEAIAVAGEMLGTREVRIVRVGTGGGMAAL
jgi:hypothetical protein